MVIAVQGPGLFEDTASYYARYRPGYPAQAFDALIAGFSLNSATRVLDLGCGTGQIAIPLAGRRIPVHAIDPDMEMLCEGIRAEQRANVCGICWQKGNDAIVDELLLPPIVLCAMGASFHWMDRENVIKKLDKVIIDGGGIAVLSGGASFWSGPGDGWPAVAKEVVIEFLGPERRAGSGTYSHPPDRHEVVLRRSPFSKVQELTFEQERVINVDDIIGQQLSTSYASPAQLRNRVEDFRSVLRERLLKLNPSGRFAGSVQSQVLIARR